ncbi:MAG: hypothetical protein A2126_00200 [Candidatus Woykebacteria bacterium GWB1_45_5]|uniref:Uncharacterized protein n=1 Tax=Candidatus Woykebacteria bacterium GWB1_45_5 TaxID=1802592 RepID=A0A1G1W8A8_9BACT|nr:MAG: hypothetical protein A2126_00200 [Candidatus Woykebacteria bacterium GWB1_45_5]
MPQSKWKIEIDRARGFAPKYYESTYPSFGNKEQAGAMRNISLVDPNVMTQGPGMAELTNGDQSGAVTTLMKGILRHAVTSNLSYGVGGAKLYSFSATAVTNAGDFPHTIDKAAVTAESGEDVTYYQSKLYYSYGHSGSAGDIGQYDLSSTFDDDWYSTVATSGAALQDGPHQMINGGDDILYITNGRFIASLNGTTASPQALDFWTNSQAVSIAWNNNRVVSAVNRPNLTGVNVNQSAVYNWNGYSSSWEGDPIEINGRIGALFVKNGITYIWYETFLDGAVRLIFGYLGGGQVVQLRTFSGTLPLYYQVGEMNDYIIWVSSGRLYAFGPLATDVQLDMFQLMSPQYTTTAGGVAAPFGEVLVASNDGGTNYSLEKEDGYETDSSYKTILFDTSRGDLKSVVDRLVLRVNQLASGAKVDLTLKDKKGTSLWTGEMSFTTDGAVTKKIFFPRATGEDLRLEYDFSNGSSSNNVAIRGTILEGRNIPMG